MPCRLRFTSREEELRVVLAWCDRHIPSSMDLIDTKLEMRRLALPGLRVTAGVAFRRRKGEIVSRIDTETRGAPRRAGALRAPVRCARVAHSRQLVRVTS